MTLAPLTFNRRLPGVVCDPALPPAGEQPLRLDVAGFVGFAERGPTDLPVPIEDVNQYANVFGGDLVLASDGGRPVYAHLPSAVQAFFDNGGRRCYIVRVAGPAATRRTLEIPGLCSWTQRRRAEPVRVQAAWAGRWSSRLSLATRLHEQPLVVPELEVGPLRLRLPPSAAGLVDPGDLVRLRFGDDAAELFCLLGVLNPHPGSGALVAEVATSALRAPGADPARDAAALTRPSRRALGALPAPTAAALLRFDLVVREADGDNPEVVETWPQLRFGGHRDDAVSRCLAEVLLPRRQAVTTRADGLRLDPLRSLRLRALTDESGELLLPWRMPDRGARPAQAVVDVPQTDDLASFDPAQLFLDQRLRGSTGSSLLADAEHIAFVRDEPDYLRGVHGLLFVDEVGLISVPDAVHRPWLEGGVPEDELPESSATDPERDWSRWQDCDVTAAAAASAPPPGPPSPPLTPGPRLELSAPQDYDPTALVDVHADLVGLCAARRDAVAVLSLPAHYRTADVLDWQRQLVARSALRRDGAISYAAVYHPWVQQREERSPEIGPLRATPPDGAACGMIAARELARGAWITPAGVPLRGVLGLTPEVGDLELTRLFDAHVNLIRSQHGNFTALSAHTLSPDHRFVHLSVRRLLILLRKLALRRGRDYAFEPNGAQLWRRVQAGFEVLLTGLLSQGAISAFQVAAGERVNPPSETDQGRFNVVINVAPTAPVEFITVTLLRTGEGLLDILEG